MTRTLSVLIPIYNHQDYFREQIESVLSQSRVPDEILVIDDASSDDSYEVAREYAGRHPDFRVMRNPKNLGVNGTLKRLLDEATSEYVTFTAADDLMLAGYLEQSMLILESHPRAALCCSYPVYFDDTRTFLREQDFGWSAGSVYYSPRELAGKLRRSGQISGHTTVVRRELLKKYILDEELRWHADAFLFTELGLRYGICFVPRGLAAFRIRLDSYVSRGQSDAAAEIAIIRKVMRLMNAPERRDILRLFAISRHLAYYGTNVIPALLGDRSLWNIRNFAMLEGLVARTLPGWLIGKAKRILYLILPAKIWNRAKSIVLKGNKLVFPPKAGT